MTPKINVKQTPVNKQRYWLALTLLRPMGLADMTGKCFHREMKNIENDTFI